VVDVSLLFGAVLFADAVALLALLWAEHFTRFEGIVLWEEESPVLPLFWGSAIVLLAGVLSLIEIPLTNRPWIVVNVGGVVAPLAVSALILVRRPALVPAAVAILGAFLVAYGLVVVAGRPFFIPVPLAFVPSAVAAGVAVAWSDWKFVRAVDAAYVGASTGLFLGLDLFPLLGYLASTAGEFEVVVLGGGGILDLVFLGGVFAVAIAWSAVLIGRRVRGRKTLESVPAGPEVEAGPRTFLWQRR